MRSNDEIIELLTRIKDEKNLSISEIARQVGMAKSAVSRYFNKTREFPLNRADDFAKVFGLSPEYLLGVGILNDEFEELSSLYSQLDYLRKQKVLSYTNKQLDEQNKVLPFKTTEVTDNKDKNLEVLAAHIDENTTEDEMDEITAFIDSLRDDE